MLKKMCFLHFNLLIKLLICSYFILFSQISLANDDFVMLGSRANPRTVLESSVPIDVISNAELSSLGITETGRLIQMLSASFNYSTSTISDGTDVIRPGTLRGLGPDQILVLINSKRLHNSALIHVNGSVGRGTAGIDFSSIPVGAIESIEILRDGAAAQYGSDAIAGVININLKADADMSELKVSGGETYDGDGVTKTIGFNQGMSLNDLGGFITLSLEARQRDATNRAGLDTRQQYSLLNNASDDPREATFNRLNHRFGDPETQDISVFINSSLPFESGKEIYLFGGINKRDSTSGGFYRRSLDARNIPQIYPDGFLPLINTKVIDYTLTAGLRDAINDNWQFDASLTTGANSLNYFITDSLNVSLGPSSQTSADAGKLKFSQTTINAELTGSVEWGKTIFVALGAEYRVDQYDISAGDFASFANGPNDDPSSAFSNQFGGVSATGIQVFPGFKASNEIALKRRNKSIFVELETDLTDKFNVGLASRFDDINDGSNNLTSKASFRYSWADNFAWRSAIGSGFRSPSLHQNGFSQVGTRFIDDGTGNISAVEVGTFSNNSSVANALGVPILKEETSNSLSLGFTSTPTDRLNISLDGYLIEIKDRIVLSGIFEPENGGGPIASALAPFNVGGAQFFSNALNTKTSGADLVATYNLALNGGKLNLTTAFHWNKTTITSGIKVPANLNGETLFDNIERVRLEQGQPRERVNLAAQFKKQNWEFWLRTNYFGQVASTESNTDPARKQTFGAKWLTDISISYILKKGIKWTIGADNVFDITPDQNNSSDSFNGISVYNRRTAPFGFNGGFYYSKLNIKFGQGK